MANYRQLHSRMWSSDQWFSELGPLHKLLFIYLFSNERASVSGLYEIPMRVIVFETGLDKETVVAGLELFTRDNKVLYDFDRGVAYVKNMLKYQGSGSSFLQKRIKADIDSVPLCALKTLWVKENTVSTGCQDGVDTTISISISNQLNSDSVEEGGGGGEGEAFRAYEANIGVLTPAIADALGDDINTYGVPWVVEAIKYAARAEKRSQSYVRGVLKGWKRDGVTDPCKRTEKPKQKNGASSNFDNNMAILERFQERHQANV